MQFVFMQKNLLNDKADDIITYSGLNFLHQMIYKTAFRRYTQHILISGTGRLNDLPDRYRSELRESQLVIPRIEWTRTATVHTTDSRNETKRIYWRNTKL